MKKSVTKYLSLVLVMVMFLSLGVTPAAAAAVEEKTEITEPMTEDPAPQEGEDAASAEKTGEEDPLLAPKTDNPIGFRGTLPGELIGRSNDLPVDPIKSETVDPGKLDAPELQLVTVVFEVTPAGAEVKVWPKDAEEDAEPLEANEDGSYSLLPGEYRYAIEAEGYVLEEKTDLVIPNQLDTFKIDVTLKETPAEEPEEETPAQEPEEIAYPAATLDFVTESGLKVVVEAPEGAFPEGTEISVEELLPENVQPLVDASNVNGKVLVAADISFYADGVKVQPNVPVEVSMTSAKADGAANPVVLHIGDDGSADVVNQIPDAGQLRGASVQSVAQTRTIRFLASSFSVYLIVDGEPEPPVEVTYRRTYKFTTDGTTPFEFYDKAGQLVSQQIVKNGDELETVTLPYSASHTFENWVVSASDDDVVAVNDVVDLPVVIDDIGSKDTTVTLKPAYGNVYYVTFHAQDLPADPDIIQTKKIVVEGEKVVIGDVIAPAPDSTHIFYGWTKDSDGSAANAVSIYDENNNPVPSTEYSDEINADLNLYPYFVEAYWLRFVSGPTGSRASYVPAQFVLADEELTELPVPTRVGYTFDGWYTGSQSAETGEITYESQVTDGAGSVTVSGGLKLTGETVLYGKWTANNNATYKVVIWRQKVTDAKDAADSAKTYDYAESAVRTGTTGNPVAPTAADMGHTGGSYDHFHYARTVQTSETINANGSTVINVYYDRDLMAINFYYKNGHQPEGAETAYTYTATTSDSGTQYGVLPDGSYVQLTRGADQPTTRVYYTYSYYNYEYTGTFYIKGNGNQYRETQYNGNNLPPEGDNTKYYAYISYYGYGDYYELTRRTETVHNYGWTYTDADGLTHDYSGTRYTRQQNNSYPYMVTWTGLYGQSFSQNGYEWPSAYEWNERSDGYGTTQTFLTDFVQGTNPYNLYDQGNTGASKIYHYKQGLDGKYHNTNTADYTYVYTANGNGGSFNFSNKFTGFTVKSYNTGNNGFSENGGSNTNMSNTPNTYPLHVYHERSKWKIEYQATPSAQSTQFSTVHTESGIYYEAPLADYDLTLAQAGIAEREHYTFTGWYADETCTSKFDFSSTMPNANVTVYAGWEPVWYQIIVDPDGGVISQDIGATYMWKKYGETFDRYEIVRPYIQDPDGEYEYVYIAGEDDPDGNISVRTATYVKQDTGKTKYRPITADDPTYTLVGWYVVDADDNTTDTPYDFDAEVTAPVKIRAVWNLGGDYGLQYNATTEVDGVTVSGTFTQSDPQARYADGAEFVIDAPPTNITPRYVFDGWEIVEPDEGETQGKVLDDNGGKFYQPGETLKLDAAKWSRHRTVYLRAHYTIVDQSDEPVAVTYLKFDPNFPTGATDTEGEATEPAFYSLNSAIDLGKDEAVPNNYAAFGYKLIGWSQDKDAEPVVHAEGAEAGKIVFGLNDVIGVDGLDPTETVTVTVNGEQKEVGCNVLYAIWEAEYFYVYHSATGKLEAISIPTITTEFFDLTEKVSDGTLYGGYFSACGGAASDKVTAAMAGAKKTGTQAVEGAVAYDASSLMNSGVRFFQKTDASKVSRGGSAVALDMVKGDELVVSQIQADDLFYLKEVPNTYLGSAGRYVYDYADNFLVKQMYLLTAIDDSLYGEAGYYVITAYEKAKIAGSFKYQQRNSTTSTTIKASDLGVTRGYVAVVDASGHIENVTSDGMIIKPYWKTLDGVTVETAGGTLSKTDSGELTKFNIQFNP